MPPEPAPGTRKQPKRRPLPDHLPREETVLAPGERCADCGGRLKRLGEDVTEELEYVPGRFVVKRIVRPRLTCGGCEKFHQAPLPPRPIERGRPSPGLLAHVLVSKYCDHLPLYRQSRIFARDGVDLDRSTARRWPAGSARRGRCWSPWPRRSRANQCRLVHDELFLSNPFFDPRDLLQSGTRCCAACARTACR